MKQLTRVLCLLLMLALLLPGALAEAVEQTEQTEQIDSSIEEDEVEKVGDIFDMYQVGSMVEANGKLYTISYGPTICELDGENWRIAVVASSLSDVLRFSEDRSFYSDETSAVLSVDEDGTLHWVLPDRRKSYYAESYLPKKLDRVDEAGNLYFDGGIFPWKLADDFAEDKRWGYPKWKVLLGKLTGKGKKGD